MRERSRICEVPLVSASCFLHTAVLLMPSDTNRFPAVSMLQNCCGVMATLARKPEAAFFTSSCAMRDWDFSFTLNRFADVMDNLSGYARRPFPFVLRYMRRASCGPFGHCVCRCGSSCLLGGHAIRREEPGRQPDSRSVARKRRMAGIRSSHVADRGRQSVCGGSRAGPRASPSSASPAICAATCSAT